MLFGSAVCRADELSEQVLQTFRSQAGDLRVSAKDGRRASDSEMVSWPFATFAACLADAVEKPVRPGFVACAVLQGNEDRPIPLIAM